MNLKNLVKTLAILALSTNVYASGSPLLQDGKTSIYKRVLTTPECVLVNAPTDKDGSKVNAFSRFYVYKDDGAMLMVGADTKGSALKYLRKDCTVEWKMQTALMFTNPANRKRQVIFKEAAPLQNLVSIEEAQAKSQIESILAKIEKNQKQDNVVSIEPKEYVDYQKQFYLLPILDFESSMFNDGNNVNLLKIASVTKQEPSTAKANTQNALKGFKAAIVFVIDSSISMDPYIEKTKETIDAITQKIEGEHLQDLVHFGLVSFRSSVKATPKLEYTSKVYVKPGEAKTKEDFAKKLVDLRQASVSSALFDEDSFAGINTALEQIDWSEYGGKYIVLITDAGGIASNNKLSSTKLGPTELKLEAEHKGVAIYAMHLLTDSGKRNHNHETAKAQYQELTYNRAINQSLYYGVNAGDVNSFGKNIAELSENITSQVKLASFGKSAIGYDLDSSSSALSKDSIKLGYAMQLAYLGKVLGTKSPSFFEGWIADRDLIDHQSQTCTPVVLLTKDELSSLKDVCTKILQSAQAGLKSPEDTFDMLRSVALSMGRDPQLIKSDKNLKLGQMGLLGEYLDDLPYTSQIQSLDADTWTAMGVDEQNQIVMELEAKLNAYQKANDDASKWIKLNEKDDIKDAVYPVPLELLP